MLSGFHFLYDVIPTTFHNFLNKVWVQLNFRREVILALGYRLFVDIWEELGDGPVLDVLFQDLCHIYIQYPKQLLLISDNLKGVTVQQQTKFILVVYLLQYREYLQLFRKPRDYSILHQYYLYQCGIYVYYLPLLLLILSLILLYVLFHPFSMLAHIRYRHKVLIAMTHYLFMRFLKQTTCSPRRLNHYLIFRYYQWFFFCFLNGYLKTWLPQHYLLE